MRPFEERFTAWVDGELSGPELEEFERELAQHPDAAGDRAAAQKLGTFLRSHCVAADLKNADFFNHQLLQRIAPNLQEPRRVRSGFSLARLAWAGAFCLIVAFGLYSFVIPKGPYENAAPDPYLAEILEAQPGDPSITATTFHTKKNNITVLWLDGLEYIPADYALK